jgi:hypothetical protein
MMHQSKKSFFVSIIFLLATVILFTFTLNDLMYMSSTLHKRQQIAYNAENITSLYPVVENIFRQNDDDAIIMYSYFLQEQEITDVISALKEYAEFAQIEVQVTHQVTVNDADEKVLIVTSNFSGTKAGVVTFLEYLDAIPYYKKNIHSDLFMDDGNQWIGNVVTEINIL